MSDSSAREKTLSEDLTDWESDRPDEWTMKRFIRKAEALQGMLGAIPSDYCPQCGDGSGAYYDNYGEVCQCQWCDIRSKALPEMPEPEGGD